MACYMFFFMQNVNLALFVWLKVLGKRLEKKKNIKTKNRNRKKIFIIRST